MNAGIFVSYAREDQVPAGALVRFLRSAGFDIWFDKDSLLAGRDWRTVIEQEIARARLLLICLSRSSVDKTGFVQKEMRLALQQAELRPSSHVYIIPVSLDGCPLPSALERLHVLDLGAPDASRRLLKAIGNATGYGVRTPRDAHDAFTTAVSSYRRRLSGLPSVESGLGEAVPSEDYSKKPRRLQWIDAALTRRSGDQASRSDGRRPSTVGRHKSSGIEIVSRDTNIRIDVDTSAPVFEISLLIGHPALSK